MFNLLLRRSFDRRIAASDGSSAAPGIIRRKKPSLQWLLRRHESYAQNSLPGFYGEFRAERPKIYMP
jgi:hypothetical protein